MRCYRCMRPEQFCLCSLTAPIKTKTKFVILIHPKEFKRERTGTGRMTHLQLENSELIMDVDFTQNQRVNNILNDSKNKCYILYPSDNSINISSEAHKIDVQDKQRVIFIIDATWLHAKKMLSLSKNLHSLQTISFDNDDYSEFKIKQQPYPKCLSTIESTKKVLDILRAASIEDINTEQFLRPFKHMVNFQIDCMENPPPGSYRCGPSKKLKEKNHYKTEKARNLFFKG